MEEVMELYLHIHISLTFVLELAALFLIG